MNPQSSDWNNFWANRCHGQIGKISWSKRRIIKVIEPFLKDKRAALDAGCGSGFFSKYFCDLGLNTVSLDYSEKALGITQASTNGRSKIVKSDLLNDPLDQKIKERFDVIFSDGLLEHFAVHEQNKIFENFKSVLLTHGRIITFVPNKWSPWELIRPLFMPGIDEKPFVINELIRLNVNNGLTVISTGGINICPFRFSPDRLLGHQFGMLLYTIAKK